jgi:hypothetical protein
MPEGLGFNLITAALCTFFKLEFYPFKIRPEDRRRARPGIREVLPGCRSQYNLRGPAPAPNPAAVLWQRRRPWALPGRRRPIGNFGARSPAPRRQSFVAVGQDSE